MKRYIELNEDFEPATWDEDDQPVTYASKRDAELAVAEHMRDCWDAILGGDMHFCEPLEQPTIHECDIDEDLLGNKTIEVLFLSKKGFQIIKRFNPSDISKMRG